MKNRFTRQFEMLSRVAGFFARYSSLFPAVGLAVELFAVLTQALPAISKAAGSEAAGVAQKRERTLVKVEARTAVLNCLNAICLAAKAITHINPIVSKKFEMPRNIGDRALIAYARGIAENVLPMKEEFINHEMELTFIDELNAAIEHLEAAVGSQVTAKDDHNQAVRRVTSTMKQALEAVYRLDGIVPNKVRNYPDAFEDWKDVRRLTHGRAPAAPQLETQAAPSDAAVAAAPAVVTAQP